MRPNQFHTTLKGRRIIIVHENAELIAVVDAVDGQSIYGDLTGDNIIDLNNRLVKHLSSKGSRGGKGKTTRSKNKTKVTKGKQPLTEKPVGLDITFNDAQQSILTTLGRLRPSTHIAASNRVAGTQYARVFETNHPDAHIAVYWGIGDKRACIVTELMVYDNSGWVYIEEANSHDFTPTVYSLFSEHAYYMARDAAEAQVMGRRLKALVDAVTKVNEADIRACEPGAILRVVDKAGLNRAVMLLEPIGDAARQMVVLYTVHDDALKVVSSAVIRVKLDDVVDIISPLSMLPVHNKL